MITSLVALGAAWCWVGAFAPPLNSTHYQSLLPVFFSILGTPDGAVNTTRFTNLACPSAPAEAVSCDASGFVTINAPALGATGQLAVGLLLHVDVRSINVSANRLVNTTYITVSNFNTTAFGRALHSVDLSRNALVDWPHAFDTLSSIDYFDLSGNTIDGPVPDLSLWNPDATCILMRPGAAETNTFCRSQCVPRGPPSCFLNVPLCFNVTCPTTTTTTIPPETVDPLSPKTPSTTPTPTTTITTAATSTTTTTTTTTITTSSTTSSIPAAIPTTKDSAIIDADDTLPIILGIAGGVLLTGIVVTIAAIYIFRASARRTERRNTLASGGTQLRSAPDPPSGSYNSSSLGHDSVASDPVSQAPVPNSTQSSEYYRIDAKQIESAYERAPIESSTYDSSSPLTKPSAPTGSAGHFNDEEFAAQAYGV
jgi:hypothetical protein